MSDVLCYRCGAPASEEAEFCPQCGTQFSKPRTYQPSPVSCLKDFTIGCLIFGAVFTAFGTVVFGTCALLFTPPPYLLRNSSGQPDSDKGLTVSAILILAVVIGFSVLLIFVADKFFKRK